MGALIALSCGSIYRTEGTSIGAAAPVYQTQNGMVMAEKKVVSAIRGQMAAWITGSVVTGILIVIGLVALYLEVSTPGFAVPGTVAIICFTIVFAGGALMGIFNSFELLLFIAGVVLLIAEIFLIPGFGITGISGIFLMMSALILSRQRFFIPEFE